MTDELKRCPFCGKPATRSNELSREMFAACDNPGCLTFGWGMPETLWQSRPLEDALSAEVARLRGALEKMVEEMEKIDLRARVSIPYYAYGDNEAACEMAHNLGVIVSIASTALPAAKAALK